MTGLRNRILLRGPKALLLLLAVLGMHALVPVGHMVTASPGYGLAVSMCPVTHPLARAAVTVPNERPAMDHSAMGVDHAAMGHVSVPHDNGRTDSSPDGTPVTAQGKSDCAFSALGAAAVDPGKISLEDRFPDGSAKQIAPLQELAIVRTDRLRPPLRAPPRNS